MDKKMEIRCYTTNDRDPVIALWKKCGLTVSSNDPETDIDLKMKFQPELFFVAETGGMIVGTVMAGYDGHRGWLNYLGIDPDFRYNGFGKELVEYSIRRLKLLGCPKLNIQVRNSNTQVIDFYRKLGFYIHEVIGMQIKL